MATRSAADSGCAALPLNDGEMLARIQAKDWSATPLGPASSWPQSLRTALEICLGSTFPTLLWWGAALTTFYNDACRPLFGTGHPHALGRPALEGLPRRWAALAPELERVLADGQGGRMDQLALHLERDGRLEERYFSLSCSPIHDQRGRVAGLLTPVVETTASTIGERRGRTLRALASLEPGESVAAACTAAAAALADNSQDLPFALLYGLDRERRCARLASVVGIAPGCAASPELVLLDNPGAEWPLARLAGGPTLVSRLERRFPALPTGAWEEAPDRAMLLPISAPGEARAQAVLIAALNPHSPLDDDYHRFLDLAAERIAATLPGRRFPVSCRRRDRAAVAEEGPVAVDEAPPVEDAQEVQSHWLGDWQEKPAALARCLGANPSRCTQVERALRESEARLRLFIDYAPVAVAMLDRGMRYLAVSRRWLTDYRLDEGILGRSHDQVFPELPERWKAVHRRALAGEVTSVEEDRFERADGSVQWLHWRVHPWRTADGAVGGIVIFTEDVTARKDSEEALRQALLAVASEELNREALRALPAGIAVIDRDGIILAVNEAWAGFAERVGAEASSGTQIGSNYLEVCERASIGGDAEAGAALAGIRSVLDGIRHQFSLEYLCQAPQGPLWFLMTVVPLGPAAQQGAVISHLDITSRRLAEEALHAADRRKDAFLATLAHELRNPLAALCNLLDMPDTSSGEHAVDVRLQGIMKRQVDHMVRLIDDLSDISRISQGKLALKRERVELASLVAQAVEISEPLIRSRRHDLVVDLPSEPIVLEADPVRIAQVLANLLANAAKYTPAGGHIRLAGRSDDGQAVVRVCDDGVGIPAEMLPRIFDLFTQVPGSSASAQGGLGIGLALVRALTEMHGGRVEAISEGPGRGSELIVRLPLVEPVGITIKPA